LFYSCEDRFHIKFGRIGNISTRKGTAVFLEDILNEAKEQMIKTIKSKQSKLCFSLKTVIMHRFLSTFEKVEIVCYFFLIHFMTSKHILLNLYYGVRMSVVD